MDDQITKFWQDYYEILNQTGLFALRRDEKMVYQGPEDGITDEMIAKMLDARRTLDIKKMSRAVRVGMVVLVLCSLTIVWLLLKARIY